MDFQLTLAIFVGKIISLLNKLSGSGGTAAPGLYALKIDPDLVKKLTSKIKNGSIVISGTNGKTTTARLTADILKSKFKIIHNRQGSNLLRGIASTLISKSSISGKIGTKETADMKIFFEAEEAESMFMMSEEDMNDAMETMHDEEEAPIRASANTLPVILGILGLIVGFILGRSLFRTKSS